MKQKPKIQAFSKHLFWDVNQEKLDMDKNKKLIIQRVLEYGLYEDWQKIYDYYGIDEISQVAGSLRSLDIRAASFVSLLSGIDIKKFRCYTTRQSLPKHSVF